MQEIRKSVFLPRALSDLHSLSRSSSMHRSVVPVIPVVHFFHLFLRHHITAYFRMYYLFFFSAFCLFSSYFTTVLFTCFSSRYQFAHCIFLYLYAAHHPSGSSVTFFYQCARSPFLRPVPCNLSHRVRYRRYLLFLKVLQSLATSVFELATVTPP